MALLDWLNPLKHISDGLVKAYTARENARNNTERIQADVEIRQLETKRDMAIAVIAEPWWTPRSLMAYCVVLYVAKIIAWDTVFGLGVTAYPGQQVTFIVMTVIGFYFVSKGAETVANVIANAMARRGGK